MQNKQTLLLLLLLLSHFSRVWLCVTPQTAAHQAPPSLGFSRQEHWSGLPFPSPMHESEKWKWSHSAVSDSKRPHGLQPTRLLHPWDSPSKNTGVGCHCLLLTNTTTKHIIVKLQKISDKENIFGETKEKKHPIYREVKIIIISIFTSETMQTRKAKWNIQNF